MAWGLLIGVALGWLGAMRWFHVGLFAQDAGDER